MRGRRRLPGTDSQRAAARRLQVRENVRAFRQRTRERARTHSGNDSSDSGQNLESGRDSSGGPGSPNTSREEYSIQTSTHQIKVFKDLIQDGVRWSLALPFKISFGSESSNAFISAYDLSGTVEGTSLFVDVPSTPPDDSTRAPSSGVVSPVISPRPSMATTEVVIQTNSGWSANVHLSPHTPGSDMLIESLLSSALYIIGTSKSDSNLGLQATQIHTQSLHSLREGFEAYDSGNQSLEHSNLLSATAMACSLSEMIINQSWERFALHMRGVGAIIEHDGLGQLATDSAVQNFYGYRTIQFPFLILERRDSFLARDEWVNIPRQRALLAVHKPMHSLLDISMQLPSEMEAFDKGQEDLSFQLERLHEMNRSLDEWKTVLHVVEHDYFSIPPPSWDDALPAPSTPPTFANFDDTHAFLLFLSIKISLLLLIRQILGVSPQDPANEREYDQVMEQLLNWARMACKCAKAVLGDELTNGKFMGLFAMDRAWEVLWELNGRNGVCLSEELDWCRAFAVELAAKGMPVMKNRS